MEKELHPNGSVEGTWETSKPAISFALLGESTDIQLLFHRLGVHLQKSP